MKERGKNESLRAWRTKSIGDVLEEVEVLFDIHFFNELTYAKSSPFLKYVVAKTFN